MKTFKTHYRPKDDRPKIETIIRNAIARENAKDLMVISDAGLAELVRREGISIKTSLAAYYRNQMGFPGYNGRIATLISQSRKGTI